MSNPFEDLSSNATRHARKKIEREAKKDAAPMVPSPLERKMIESRALLAEYKRWKAMIRRGMSAGLFGPEIVMLFRYLRKRPSPADLLRWVEGSQWLQSASADTRYAVFGWLDGVMISWNVRHGLPPMDDGLWDEPDGPFVAMRKLLTTHRS